MQTEEELAKIKPQKEMLVTIGVFDGVHLGHQHLLTYLKNSAQKIGLLSGVVTFKSHPQSTLVTERQMPWLSNLENRASLIRGLGIDVIVALTFTPELAQLAARDFVQLLKDYLKMGGLVLGPDFALGKNREGDIERLRSLGKEMGFSVEVIPSFVLNGEVVSSTTIRQALAQGDVSRVEKLLGRPFGLSGTVIPGDKRGAVLGFPTANLDLNPEQASPSNGVYVTITYINHEPLPSITNIGTRPTFGGEKRLAETFLLDYEGQLMGQGLKINLIDKLRNEKRFDNTEQLKSQIGIDIEQAKIILHKRKGQKGNLA